jgi:hypothetical protein
MLNAIGQKRELPLIYQLIKRDTNNRDREKSLDGLGEVEGLSISDLFLMDLQLNSLWNRIRFICVGEFDLGCSQ